MFVAQLLHHDMETGNSVSSYLGCCSLYNKEEVKRSSVGETSEGEGGGVANQSYH